MVLMDMHQQNVVLIQKSYIKQLAGKEVNMEKLTAYRKFADSLEAHIEKSDISNGDKLTVYVEYDTQAAADSGVRVAGSSYNIRAKGIGNGTKIVYFLMLRLYLRA